MNLRFLIDRIVRDSAHLLAEIATLGGARAPLSELGDQLFIHLAMELDRRGVGRKVSADMFGMTQRAYLKKLQRLAESSTEKGTSIWLAVLDFVVEQGSSSRAEILLRFCRDDEAQLRAVLFDLCESGLIRLEGRGDAARYSVQELANEKIRSSRHFGELLWLEIFHAGPLSKKEILHRSSRASEEVEQELRQLLAAARIEELQIDGEISYHAPHFIREVDDEAGWEAAILDHYQALVGTLVSVLPELIDASRACSSPAPKGGYTYQFDLWEGHPLAEEVHGILSQQRKVLSELRAKVDRENAQLGRARGAGSYSVSVYGGQCSRLLTPSEASQCQEAL